MAVDPILRPMYPETDLKAAATRLQWFLEQYWGGPTTYQENRGHPRLRMRHAQFHINLAAHQIGGAIAAFGAAVLRVKLGDYAVAFYISGALCLITTYFVLQIAKGKDMDSLRT